MARETSTKLACRNWSLLKTIIALFATRMFQINLSPRIALTSSASSAWRSGANWRTNVRCARKVSQYTNLQQSAEFLEIYCLESLHDGNPISIQFFLLFLFTVFDFIIHNVKSKTEYDKYKVVSNRPEPSDSPINLADLVIPIVPIELNSVFHRVNFFTNHSPRRRFTYRTRFEATLEQNERIQELFGGATDNNYTRLTPAEWRRYIYDRHLYALPLPDLTGRHRECTAEFYRWVENDARWALEITCLFF